jgi:hypothetical protein
MGDEGRRKRMTTGVGGSAAVGVNKTIGQMVVGGAQHPTHVSSAPRMREEKRKGRE